MLWWGVQEEVGHLLRPVEILQAVKYEITVRYPISTSIIVAHREKERGGYSTP